MDLGLKDKVVVCMSSASGFGKGIATEFAREGAKVVICTSEAFKAELDQAVIDIEKETGNRPHPYMYDVLNNESITAMINKVAEDLGGIYGLVNHCPGPKAGTFEALTEADWADGYQKCLYSYTTAIRAALPYMKQGGGGRIVNSTSSSIKQELDIYFMSSLFLGLTVCSLPFVISAERKSLRHPLLHGWLLLLGIAVVVGLTLLRTDTGALGSVNYAALSPLQFGYLFLSGAVAITAMVLPGISGSSILLIAGVYLPTIQAIHSFLRFRLEVIPGLCALGFGVIAGVGLSIRAIRTALRKYRAQTVWLILGLMLGSLYAIANGPASLDTPLPPMDLTTFQFPAFALGVVILLALEFLKKAMERQTRICVV